MISESVLYIIIFKKSILCLNFFSFYIICFVCLLVLESIQYSALPVDYFLLWQFIVVFLFTTIILCGRDVIIYF